MEDNQKSEVVTAVGNLKTEHIDITRKHLKVAQCFGALARFEELVSKAPGVDILSCWVWTTKQKKVVASGLIIMRFPGDEEPVEIGRWSVKWAGVADVYLGDVKFLDQKGDELERALNAAWRNGTVTAAIRQARER